MCAVSKINKGSQPTDGGNLIITAEEYEDFIKKEPKAKKFIRKFWGAEEFINGKERYCLWLVDATPAEMRKMPLVAKRVEAVRQKRLESTKAATRNWAAYPYLFTENRQPESGNYLLIPSVSSERRSYVPIGFLDASIVASNLVLIIPNATLYEFGVLTSSVHMAWMRVVCGRLESRYRYSNDIVYNNFPFVTPSAAVGQKSAVIEKKAVVIKKKTAVIEPVEMTDSETGGFDKSGHHSALNHRNFPHCTTEQAHKIEQTAQGILDARAKFPDSTLADLYDDTFMPPDLRKAHRENDRAVMEAYGFGAKMTEAEIVGELFKMYERLSGQAR